MADAAQSGSAEVLSVQDTPADPLAALRERGGERADPVRFHFLAALARRIEAQQGEARRVLDDRLAQALAEFATRFELAQGEARDLLAAATPRHPAVAGELHALFAAGDFAALRRRVAALDHGNAGTPLAELTARLAQPAAELTGIEPTDDTDAQPVAAAELKSLRYFRNSWAKISVEQQLAQALAQAPENAGPLNSHLLVLRSLERMREVSPDYLSRFMSYVDALLWLAQADGISLPAERPVAAGDGDKKRSRAAAGAGKAAKAGR